MTSSKAAIDATIFAWEPGELGIYEDDTALDLRGEFLEQLQQGIAVADIEKATAVTHGLFFFVFVPGSLVALTLHHLRTRK